MSELYHHQRLHAKWGVHNGPPYPLNKEGLAKFRKRNMKGKTDQADYSKMSDDEKSQAKEKAIREGNIREANANRNEFTDSELQAVKKRFELNQDVAKLSKATIKTGQQKAEEIASKFETAAKLTNAVANTTANGIKIYNSLGAVYAHVNGTPFTPINTGGGGKKKKDK